MKLHKNLKLMLLILVVSFLALAYGHLPKMSAAAGNQKMQARSNDIAIHAAGRGAPWFNLQNSRDIYTPVGNQMTPRSLAAGDLNGDGYDDLVTGYAGNGRGTVTLHYVDSEAMSPRMQETLQEISEGRFPEPFLPSSTALELPVAPDFLAVGDFDFDGKADVVAAAKGGDAFYLLSGNGHGDFQPARRFAVDGAISTLVAGNFNPGLVKQVAVGLETSDGWQLAVYGINAADGTRATMERCRVNGPVNSLAFGQLDDFAPMDLAVVASGELLILHGLTMEARPTAANTVMTRLEKINLPSKAKTLATGEFTWDRGERAEIAVLSTDGAIRILSRGQLDTRPWQPQELNARAEQLSELSPSSPKGFPRQQREWTPYAAERWQIGEPLPLNIESTGDAPVSTLLQPIHMANQLSDDLMVLNSTGRQLQVAIRPDKKGDNEVASQNPEIVTMPVNGAPIAALPMRLSLMSSPGLVVMREGHTAVSHITLAPQASFTVTNTNDSGPGSLRAAIAAANNGDTVFATGITGTILLQSEIIISKHIEILGPPSGTLTVSGNDTVRVFNITAPAGGTVSIGRLTITHGFSSGLGLSGAGAAIKNTSGANLTLLDCTISNNTDNNPGGVGVIYNTTGTLRLTNCTVSNNSGASVGAIRSEGTSTLTNCALSNNSNNSGGGFTSAILNYGTMTLTNCNLTDNTGPYKYPAIFNFTTLMLAGCTISGTDGGNGEGGAILSGGTLTLDNCTLSNNIAGRGGAIDNKGSATLTNCEITGNSVTGVFVGSGSLGKGGGIHNESGASGLTLTNCTISGNSYRGAATGGGGGGGIFLEGGAAHTFTNCTFSNNSSNLVGGAIFFHVVNPDSEGLTLTNCTFTGNRTALNGFTNNQGGAIASEGLLTIKNCTFSGNLATLGGAIRAGTGSSLTISNSIVAGNSSQFQGHDFSNTATTTSSFNLIGDENNSGIANGVNGNIVGTHANPLNPMLSPLGNYGGLTPTMGLLPGSPAINAGTFTNAPATDQRGIARPQLGAVDIGAFESSGFTLAIAGGNNQSAGTNQTFIPLSVAVTGVNGEPVDGGRVTFTPPASGPGCTIAGNPATIVGGVATSGTVTANAITGGPYMVTASMPQATSINFSLTNIFCPNISVSNPGSFATVTVPFDENFTQSGGAAPVTFSLNSGTLPPGFTLEPGGRFSGTPSQVGNFPFSVKATDANGCTGISQYTLRVGQATTTTTITNAAALATPTLAGEPYTVEVSVSINPPASGLPSGSITVSDGVSASATIYLPLTSCTLISTYAGPKTITATYNGDNNYSTSTAASVTHPVNKGDTITTITSVSRNPSGLLGVTVNYKVEPVAPSTALPTGIMTISGGGGRCFSDLQNGSCDISFTTPGTFTISATYAGDSGYNGSSATISHTAVAPPSISKSFSPSSVPIGGTTTLTFIITNPTANTVASTGVNFTDIFPANMVIASPLVASTTSGGVLQDANGGTLEPGDTGIRLVNGTLGVASGNTCTVTVNVTPTAAGPLNNTTRAVESIYGIGNRASATLLTNLPPTITSNTITLKADSNPSSFVIGTADDPDDPNHTPNTLGIKINGGSSATSNGVTVNNLIIDQTGQVTANISTTCAASLGNTTFSLAVTDSQGGTGTGTLTVNVTPETTKPEIACANVAAQTASAGTNCSAIVPDVRALVRAQSSDNCTSTASLTVTQNPAQGTSVGLGSHQITVTVTDAANNSETCVVGFSVSDVTKPVIACNNIPAQTVTVDASCSATIPDVIALVRAQSSDNCTPNASLTVTQSPAAGTSVGAGSHLITVTVTDASNNSETCTVGFTANDTQPPVITCPANKSVGTDQNQCSAAVTYTLPSVSDNCSGVGAPQCNPPSGSVFPKGTTTVTCTVSDTAGNQANCSFTVTVNDTQPPAMTCPANITRGNDPNLCTAVVTFAPTVSDNCPGVGTPQCNPPSGSMFPKGTTTVTCTVRDAANNQSPPCSFTVTVNDLQPPAIVCPANVSVPALQGQCSAVVTYAAPAVNDNCPGVGVPVCNPPSGSSFPKGTTTVTCLVRDSSNNQSSCSFVVNVNDTQPPVIVCPVSIITNTVNPGETSVAVNFALTVTDNCPGASVVCAPPAGSQFPRGTTLVTCIATDSSNNQTSCSFTVRVFDYVIVSDTTGKILRFDSVTGDYDFLDCRKGTKLTGIGTVTKTSCKIDLKDNGLPAKDREIVVSANNCTKVGSATITYAGVTHTISDANLSSNISNCP